MSGLFGGGTTISTSETPLTAFNIQTSVHGKPLPLIYGRNRVSVNLIDYDDFTPIAHTTTSSSSGGKGGGEVTQSNTTYTYTVGCILSLGEGPIYAVNAYWVDKEYYSDVSAFSVFLGSYTQNAWPSWVTKHADKALAYRGIAYVAAANYDLGSSASLGNHSFDVTGMLAYQAGFINEANPKDVISDYLTNIHHGAGFPLGYIGNWLQYSNYCLANNLLLSPVYDTQQEAREAIDQLLQLTNSGVFFSEGVLKIAPFGDTAITGNAVTYTPDVTAQYNLTDSDYLDLEEPVRVSRTPNADAYNQVQIEFSDAANQFNPAIATAQDQAAIELYGLRTMAVITAHCITDAVRAGQIAQLILQRQLYTRNVYETRVGWRYARLEPCDYVTLTDSTLGLSQAPVRVLSIEEDEHGSLTLTAEDAPTGVASSPLYNQPVGAGNALDFNVAPGDAHTPVIFEPPNVMTAPDLEVWLATSGGEFWGGADVWVSEDNASYRKIGAITNPARHGTLYGALSTYAGVIGEPAIATWNTGNGAGVADDVVGPDGLTASKLITDSNATLWQNVYIGIGSVSAGQTVKRHFFVKKDSNNSRFVVCRIALTGGTAQNGDCALSTDTGVAAFYNGAVGTVTAYGEWWRVELSITNTGANNAAALYFYPAGGSVPFTYLASTTGSAVIWTGDLSATDDPDTTNELLVDLSVCSGQLISGTVADAELDNTLLWVDGELISYATAQLMTAYHYKLTYLKRGRKGSNIGAHTSGSQFARLDEAIFKYVVPRDLIGKPVWIKLCSFNVFGSGLQTLDSVTAYNYTITGNQPPGLSALAATGGMFLNELTWAFADPDAYDREATEIWGATSNNRSLAVQLTSVRNPVDRWTHPGLQAGQHWYYWGRAVDTAGNISDWYPALASAGIHAQTSTDAAEMLTLLQGQLTLAELAPELANPIGNMATSYVMVADANGKITGMRLGADASGSTNIVMLADKLTFVQPDGSGTPQPVLTVGTINGQPALGFAGHLLAADGSFSGQLLAATGTFTGALNAATGTFSGALSAATGTFAGALAAGVLNAAVFDSYQYEYTTAGGYNLTIPALKAGWSAIKMRITIQGAGGGGGGAWYANNYQAPGAGGGAGQKIIYDAIDAVPGQNVVITIGSGGVGGSGSLSTNGATSGSVGGLTQVVVNGVTTYPVSAGGGGGASTLSGSTMTYGVGGSVGGQNARLVVFLYAGAGGTSFYGAGGTAGTGAAVNGGTGARGAGGGGAMLNLSPSAGAGGDGGPGYVLIEFYDPNTIVLNSRYSNLITWLDSIGHGAVPANAR